MPTGIYHSDYKKVSEQDILLAFVCIKLIINLKLG